MSAVAEAEEILGKLIGSLGFEASIKANEEGGVPCLEIETEESSLLIGRRGERLEDLQYLVNRILQKKVEEPPKIKLDCDGYRAQQEERLVELARKLADKVKETGRPTSMKPLNSYDRRIVHNALVDDPEVETSSPGGPSRMKKITIHLKH